LQLRSELGHGAAKGYATDRDPHTPLNQDNPSRTTEPAASEVFAPHLMGCGQSFPLPGAPKNRLPRRRDAEHRDPAVLRAEFAGIAVVEAGDGPAFLGVVGFWVLTHRAQGCEATLREVGVQRFVRAVVHRARGAFVA
jgi:hypothetical protein